MYHTSVLPVDFVIIAVSLLIVILVTTALVSIVTRVPFVPTTLPVTQAMVRLARLTGTECVYDLGAGTGSILHEVKKQYPTVHTVGIELSPFVWLSGVILHRLRRSGVQLRLANALHVSLHDADVIFLYMTPNMMERLETSFRERLRPGTVIVTHGFTLPHTEPEERVLVPRRWDRPVPVYRYLWKPKVS